MTKSYKLDCIGATRVAEMEKRCCNSSGPKCKHTLLLVISEEIRVQLQFQPADAYELHIDWHMSMLWLFLTSGAQLWPTCLHIESAHEVTRVTNGNDSHGTEESSTSPEKTWKPLIYGKTSNHRSECQTFSPSVWTFVPLQWRPVRIDLERTTDWWQLCLNEPFVQTLLNRSHTVVFLTPVKVLTAPSGSAWTSAVISGLWSEPENETPLCSIWEYCYDIPQKTIPFPWLSFTQLAEQSGGGPKPTDAILWPEGWWFDSPKRLLYVPLALLRDVVNTEMWSQQCNKNKVTEHFSHFVCFTRENPTYLMLW